MNSRIKAYYPEIIASLLCLLLGILSGYGVKAADSLWFINLNKPFFNPPNWIFGPVWTVLYLMMGVALGKLWKEREKNKGLIALFSTQFVLNLIWSPLFFYFQRIDLALLDISVLWISLIIFMILAWSKRAIVILFLPYILWVSFAAILNFSLYKMNIV
jgi:benzodiazapine receptor